MSARTDYIAALVAAGYTPNRAVLFEAGTGTPPEVYGNTITANGSPGWLTEPTRTSVVGATTNNVTDYWSLGTPTFLSNGSQTILVVRMKTDTTARGAVGFGPQTMVAAERCSADMPWSDGVISWDFGGFASPNRVQWTGYDIAARIEALAFRGGAAGMSIWWNGAKVASSPTAVTRSPSSSDFRINGGSNQTGDLQHWFFFAAIPAEVSDAVLATFTPENVLGPGYIPQRLPYGVGDTLGIRSSVTPSVGRTRVPAVIVAGVPGGSGGDSTGTNISGTGQVFPTGH